MTGLTGQILSILFMICVIGVAAWIVTEAIHWVVTTSLTSGAPL